LPRLGVLYLNTSLKSVGSSGHTPELWAP
jgi:hypothetical protein